MGTKMFGEYFKRLRQKKGFTLRKFCAMNGFDPGNISKLERGITPAPKSPGVLENYASALALEKGSSEWNEFFDLAAISAGQIPPEIMSDEKLLGKLPLFFRTLKGEKISDEKLDNLIRLLRES